MPHNSIHRPIRAQAAELARQSRAATEMAFEILQRNPKPDTFLGRKSQEPFRQEDEDTHMAKWMAQRPLQLAAPVVLGQHAMSPVGPSRRILHASLRSPFEGRADLIC
jgi:hypothetical protein